MTKTYDCFIFFNELELLDIRLNMLNDKVDKFVLVESTVTFTGNKKSLYYLDNKHLFEKFNHKIVHYVVDDTPNSFEELQRRYVTESNPIIKQKLLNCLTTSNVPPGAIHWLREFYQKECMKDALIFADVSNEDVCYISDLDEIWNADILYPIDDTSIYKCEQIVYSTFLNLRSNEYWAGTYYTKFKNIKEASINHLDTQRKTEYEYIKNGGWHFSYQGGIDRIKTKLESFGHQEYNNDYIKNNVEYMINNGKDVLGRPEFSYWIDEVSLPKYIIENKEKYKHLIK